MRGATDSAESQEEAESQAATLVLEEGRFFEDLAAAFVRGKLPCGAVETDPETIGRGLAAGLRLHKFKPQSELPRVRRVLGILRSIHPETLLDIGSGRGTFLWPFMAAMPQVRVVSVELSPRRVFDIGAVRRGGQTRLRSCRMDAQHLAFADRSFDVVTLLETLEHMPDPQRAIVAAARVARRFVIASVPSKEDDNPEHIHLFTSAGLAARFTEAGVRKVNLDGVPNHIVLVARVQG